MKYNKTIELEFNESEVEQIKSKIMELVAEGNVEILCSFLEKMIPDLDITTFDGIGLN